jgi:hypothetical protein
MTDEQPPESYSMLVNALLRYLLCISPWRAEGVYYQSHQASPLHDDKWTRVTSAGHTGWIFIDRQAGTGMFRSSPPRGVDPKSIPAIEIPTQYRVGLRTMADTLVAQVGGATAYPRLANLLDRLLAMGNGRFETAEVAKFLDSCTDPQWFPAGLAGYRSDLVRGMCEGRYPGYFVGLMLLLLKAISGVEAIVLSGALMSRQSTANLIGLIGFALGQIAANDGPEHIDRAAQELRAEGKSHLAEARKATREEAFYGHVFLSCPFFYGAKMAFEYLAAVSEEPEARRTYEKADYECEELLMYASSSLLSHFVNLKFGWSLWQEHGRRVSEIRKTKGTAAGERQVMEYLELAYFYPEHYRHALHNGLKPPPETAGTAGGATIGELCGGSAIG